MTDFTKINGIGKKTSEALYKAGVEDFAQLAALSPDEIEQMLSDQGVRVLGNVEDWIAQARDLFVPGQTYTTGQGYATNDFMAEQPVWEKVDEAHAEIIALGGEVYVTNDAQKTWAKVDEAPAWNYDFGGAEFDDESFLAMSNPADGGTFFLEFSAHELANLKALRDTMTRFFGPNITVVSMIRRMLNEHLIQHGYEKLDL